MCLRAPWLNQIFINGYDVDGFSLTCGHPYRRSASFPASGVALPTRRRLDAGPMVTSDYPLGMRETVERLAGVNDGKAHLLPKE